MATDAGVTLIDFSAPSAFTVGGTPITSSGTIALGWGAGTIPVANLGAGIPSIGTYLRGDGTWATPATPNGTVTSVGLGVPVGFTVTGSPVTNNGVMIIDWDSSRQIPPAQLGTGPFDNTKFLRGDGTWAIPPSATGGTVQSVGLDIGDISDVIKFKSGSSPSPITTVGTWSLTWGTGKIPVLNLGGIGADNTKFLRGDGTWATTPVPTLDYVLTQGNTSTQTANLGGLTVSGTARVGTVPTSPTDIVRLQDLQNSQKGLTFKTPVQVVAQSSVGTTYTNGTAGVGATVTGAAPLIIDGVTPVVGARVLLINQSALTGAANGISNGAYDVTNNPGSGNFVLTRSSDSTAPAYGDYYFVSGGTLGANSSYVNNTVGVVTVGTTAITYSQFSSSPQAGSVQPLAGGVANAGTSSQFSRQDHIHPFSLTTTGTGAATYNSSTGLLNIPASSGGTVSNVSAISPASGLTLTVATPTTTPVLTLAYNGQIPPVNLGGLGGSATTFLNGLGQWGTPAGTATGTVTGISSSLAAFNFGAAPTSTPILTAVGGGDTTTFLRSDGNWAVPPGTGANALTAFTIGTQALPLTMAAATNSSGVVTLSSAWDTTHQIPSVNLGAGAGLPTSYLAGSAGTTAVWTAFPTVVSDISFTGAAAAAFISTPSVVTNTIRQISFIGVTNGGAQFLRGDGTWSIPGGTGTGTVTSVGLQVPTPLTISSGSPVTGNGTIALAWGAGQIPLANLGTNTPTAGKYLAGDGSWTLLPNPGAGTVTGISASTPLPLTVSIDNTVAAIPKLVFGWASTGQIPLSTLGAGTPTSSKYLSGDGIWEPFPTIPVGTVRSIGMTVPTPLSVLPIAPITDTGTFALSWGTGQIPPANLGANTPLATKYLAGDGNWTLFPTLNAGTVTSVDLQMPTGFVVSGRPITSSGTFAVGYSGYIPVTSLGSGTPDNTKYLSGDGTWTPLPSGGGGTGSVTSIQVTSGTTAIAVSPSTAITTSGVYNLSWGTGQVPLANLGSGIAAAGKYVDGASGAWTTLPAGTVTSIGLDLPAPFNLNTASITTSGTFTATWGTGQIPPANLGSGSAIATNFLNGLGVWTPAGTGSVTSVGVSTTAAAPLVANNSPITSTGTIALSWGSGQIPPANLGSGSAISTNYLNGLGQWAPIPAGGTVTSVGLSVPTGFSVSTTTITSSGNFAITYSGQIPASSLGTGSAVVGNYLNGLGQWAPIATPTLNAVLGSGNSSALGATLGSLSVGAAPVNTTDVVRLVDLQTQQILNYKSPVKYLATSSIGTTYTNNTGVGTATVTGPVPLIIDGITLTSAADTGARVLLTDQSAITGAAFGVSNGIYTVTTISGSNFTLTRTSEVPAYGNYYLVLGGTTEDFTSWVNNTSGTITVGTSPISYVQFFAAPNAAISTPLASAIAAVGTSVRYAREDHVHPFSLTTTGSSGSASYNSSTGVLNIPSVGGGTVTNVSASSTASAISVSVTTPTSTPTITIGWGSGVVPVGNMGFGLPAAGKYVDGATGTWTSLPTINPGTVTSVSLSLPSPFSITTPTVSSSGTLTAIWGTGQVPVANLGTNPADNTKYLRGDGAWTPFPTINSGTVTSVGFTTTGGSPISITGGPITTSGTFNLAWGTGYVPVGNLGSGSPAASTYLAGNGEWTTFPSFGSGTVTSVGLTMPSPFTSPSAPITSSGTFSIGWGNGQIPAANLGSGSAVSANYLAGNGVWTPFPTINSGTISSITMTVPSPFSLSTATITTSGTFALTWGSGQIPVANLGTGTAVASTYLDGNGKWTPLPTFTSGTVTSVDLSMPGPFLVTGRPITDSGTISVGWGSGQIPAANLGSGTAVAANYLAGNGVWTPFPAGSLGTVTSVDVTMPSTFTKSGSAITTNGTIGFDWGTGKVPVANLASGLADDTKYLAGDGTWTPFPAGNVGTVTSIGLTMPDVFTVSPATAITSNGTFAVTFGTGKVPPANLGGAGGTASKFLDGTGTWVDAVNDVSTTIAGFTISTPTTTPILKIASGTATGSYLDNTGNFSVPPFADPIPFAIALG